MSACTSTCLRGDVRIDWETSNQVCKGVLKAVDGGICDQHPASDNIKHTFYIERPDLTCATVASEADSLEDTMMETGAWLMVDLMIANTELGTDGMSEPNTMIGYTNCVEQGRMRMQPSTLV